jgi:signal transduction histidine kinase
MGARTIRGHLFQVLAFCIVPIGLFASGLLYLHWQAQERERERAQIESVRALATAVDNALDSTVQRLSILARLWAASGASDEVIRAQAVAALAANPDWDVMISFRADGTPAFRTDSAFGAPAPRMKLLGLWGPLLEGRAPFLVTDVFHAPARDTKVVSVGVPVVKNGKVTHLVIVALNLRWFDELLARQDMPEGGVAGIFDRNWRFVARSTEGDQRRGTAGAAPLVEDMKVRPEGIDSYNSLNAIPVYTSWTPSRHGWRVAWATPSAPVQDAFWTYLGVFGFLWATAVLAGIAYAVHKGRHIAAALESVERRAEALGRDGELERLTESSVAEVDRALRALERASGLLREAQRERDRAFETEREAREAAEAANRAKDEFLAMLGHELRNPLAAIASAAVLVGQAQPRREHLEFAAGVIQRQSRHLKRLIDDLLDVGRAMTGKIALERARIDLATAVRHVVEALGTSGRLAERRLEVEAEPAWIDGDSTRVEQIVTNLLVNAATYTTPGGTIRVRVRAAGGEACIEVSDDGRGIAPESLARVFDLFYQADASMDRTSGGLGIGLTLVQRLAALHGGSVEARSAGLGKGATFVVRFPTAAAATASRAA